MIQDITSFAEYSVKKEYIGSYGKRRKLLIAGYIAFPIISLIVLFAMLGLMSVFIFIPLCAAFAFAVILPTYRRFCCIEYDYRVTTGDAGSGGWLDIAEVYNQRSRKEILSVNVSDLEVVAPYSEKYKESAERREYDEVIDVTSRIDSDGVYYAIIRDADNSDIQKILFFEPSEKMLKLMHRFNRNTVLTSVE